MAARAVSIIAVVTGISSVGRRYLERHQRRRSGAGGASLQGLARITAIADRYALPDQLRKSQETSRSVSAAKGDATSHPFFSWRTPPLASADQRGSYQANHSGHHLLAGDPPNGAYHDRGQCTCHPNDK